MGLDPTDQVLGGVDALLGQVELDAGVAHGVVVSDPVGQAGQDVREGEAGHATVVRPSCCRRPSSALPLCVGWLKPV